MADLQDQQRRVVFANGQTIILEKSVASDTINNVSPDILSQALQDATVRTEEESTAESNAEFEEQCEPIKMTGEEVRLKNEPILAVYQGAHGETHTIQLTTEEAKSLGIHFTSGDDQEMPDLSISNGSDNLQLSDDMTQMVYSESADQNESEVMFESQDIMQDTMVLGDENEQIIVNGNQQITLIPQFINGQMTYTVKLPDELVEDNDDQFDDIDLPSSIKDEISTSSKYHDITSFVRAGHRTSTTSLPATVQSINNQCSRTSAVSTSLLANKKQKLSYVDIPTRSAVSNIGSPLTTPYKMINHSSRPSVKTKVIKTEPSVDVPASTSVVSNHKLVPVTISKNKSTNLLSTSTINRSKPHCATDDIRSSTSITMVPVTTSKFTNVLTSEGRLVTGSTTSKGILPTKQISREVSAALSKSTISRTINKSKPLGSSENPIQLVQQGQTFHSVQCLNQDQLKQIATVLQKQHLEKPQTTKTSTKSVIYNAETNTRIIYRVVYPEDLDLKDAGQNKLAIAPARGRGSGRRGRPPKSASMRGGLGRGYEATNMDLDEERLQDDSTKGERKKQVARTRSGRVSRPPRHMVKDYKRLHHLDFAEPDLDDSDGGYSDYQSVEQDNDSQNDAGSELGKDKLLSGLVSSKRNISSHFRCPTCQKIYLGHTRMSRHFEMYPDHGSIQHEPSVDTSLVNKPIASSASSRGRGKRKGPWAYITPEVRSERRKVKLREVLTSCEAGELSEVAGPAVAGSLSLWDLLLLRVDAVRTEESYVATLCDELGALIEKVRSVASEILVPYNGKQEVPKEEIIDLQDAAVCGCLGISRGQYIVEDKLLRPSNLSFSSKRVKTETSFENPDTPACPDVLTALTLIAKRSDASLSKIKIVPDLPTSKLDEELLLPSDTEINNLSTSQELGIDEIVNESLNNLTAGSYESNPSDIQASHLISTLEHYQSDNKWGKEKDLEFTDAEEFDPEIALAAMGEGVDTERDAHVVYDPHMSLEEMNDRNEGILELGLSAMDKEKVEEFRSNVTSSSESYDPDMNLSDKSRRDSSPASRTFPGLDVSLDESEPELDFEALSEEFNRNTRHDS